MTFSEQIIDGAFTGRDPTFLSTYLGTNTDDISYCEQIFDAALKGYDPLVLINALGPSSATQTWSDLIKSHYHTGTDNPIINQLFSGSLYASESTSLFNRFTNPPNHTRRVLIDSTIKSLKTNGIWDKLDGLYLLAASDSQAAQRNWINNQYNLVPTNNPVFTVDRGYKGDGIGAILTANNYNPSLGNTLFMLNSASFGIFIRQAASYDGATTKIDLNTGIGRLQRGPTVENRYSSRVNDATSLNLTSPTMTGHFTAQRGAASGINAVGLYYNGGESKIQGTISSTSISTSFVLFGATTAYSDAEISFAYMGQNLSEIEISSLHTILMNYLLSVGA